MEKKTINLLTEKETREGGALICSYNSQGEGANIIQGMGSDVLFLFMELIDSMAVAGSITSTEILQILLNVSRKIERKNKRSPKDIDTKLFEDFMKMRGENND